jgi:glutathione S-transferase
VLEGLDVILKYIARCAGPGKVTLYGSSPLEACQIDQWIHYAATSFVSGPGLEAAVASASTALALRTFAVGHSLSIADLAAWGALQSAPMWPKVRKLPATLNLLRWFEFISAQPAVTAQLAQRPTKASAVAAAATTSSAKV